MGIWPTGTSFFPCHVPDGDKKQTQRRRAPTTARRKPAESSGRKILPTQRAFAVFFSFRRDKPPLQIRRATAARREYVDRHAWTASPGAGGARRKDENPRCRPVETMPRESPVRRENAEAPLDRPLQLCRATGALRRILPHVRLPSA